MYAEETVNKDQTFIDLGLFKRIAFNSGMPLIVVDIFSWLTGQDNHVKSLFDSIYERATNPKLETTPQVKPQLTEETWKDSSSH